MLFSIFIPGFQFRYEVEETVKLTSPGFESRQFSSSPRQLMPCNVRVEFHTSVLIKVDGLVNVIYMTRI
jgi:hypothetical protein